MIKFKEFDVGDIHHEEQIEQFQKEHQNAEFVQITGGYTSYEKIWFKYEDGIEPPELNENQLEISYIDLAVIIESIYYGEDEDVSDIEDLLKYLRNNGHLSTVLTVSRGISDE